MRNGSDRERALAASPVLRAIAPQLAIYETLLRRWQAKMNLVGPSTLPDLWWRHFADSAQLAHALDGAQSWVDLGSGAGFPGLVLAIASRHADPDGTTAFRLVESDLRKAAFLREVSRETGAAVEVLTQRAEAAVASLAAPSIVSSRAMAAVPDLLRLTRPWLAAGTRGLFLVGREQGAAADTTVENLVLARAPSRVGDGFVLEARCAQAED